YLLYAMYLVSHLPTHPQEVTPSSLLAIREYVRRRDQVYATNDTSINMAQIHRLEVLEHGRLDQLPRLEIMATFSLPFPLLLFHQVLDNPFLQLKMVFLMSEHKPEYPNVPITQLFH